jgi:hypothetical protein
MAAGVKPSSWDEKTWLAQEIYSAKSNNPPWTTRSSSRIEKTGELGWRKIMIKKQKFG